jgi:osmotically inducible lipoprotein OsmB
MSNPNIKAAVMLLGLVGCAGMSQQEKSTAVGAGVGAVIGHEVSK